MSKNLTVIIPVLNDLKQLFETINSVRTTNSGCKQPKILVIDDCSEDGLNGSMFSGLEGVEYIRNQYRLGVGRSRDVGVANCKTDYFIIIDAHMRFKTFDWASKVESLVRRNGRTFINLTCLTLSDSMTDLSKANKCYGATLKLRDVKPNGLEDFLVPKWAPKVSDDLYELPIMMGAAYASSKIWYDEIQGFEGALGWGSSELILSLKTWMLGGRVLQEPNIEVGHIFRDTPTYKSEMWTERYNKLLLMSILLPNNFNKFVFDNLAISNANKEAIKALKGNTSISLKRQFFQRKIKLEFKDYCRKFNIQGYEQFENK